jgi:hypothetical protein
MQLSAVLLARAIALVETFDLNPRGKVYYPDIVQALVQRYGFQKYPTKIEELDEGKGVEFLEGKSGDSVIEKLTVYTDGIVLDGRTSTQESKRLIEEAIEWASKELGLYYERGMVRRWGYLSQVTFEANSLLLSALSPAVAKLAARVASAFQKTNGDKLDWEPTVLSIQIDALLRRVPPAGFTIQRRAGIPFPENKFFSEAPLETDLHLALLQQFESEVLEGAVVARRSQQ